MTSSRQLRVSLVAAWLAGGAASAALAAAEPAAAPPLDAVVSHETRQVLANGVVRSERWQERMVRRGDSVWTERVLPPEAVRSRAGRDAAHAGEPGDHKHFDFDSAARLAWRDPKGEVQVQYVDRLHRQLVSVPKAEWSAAGFDGRLDAAAHLVPPGVIDHMVHAGSAPDGAEWRTDHSAGWQHRVLWSPRQQIALRIESKRDDGSVQRVVSVRLAAPPAAGHSMPWQQLDGYQRLEYDDFMD